MGVPKVTDNEKDGYKAELDMGADGKFELHLLRMRTQMGRPIPELIVRHSAVDDEMKWTESHISLDHDNARIYLAFLENAVEAMKRFIDGTPTPTGGAAR